MNPKKSLTLLVVLLVAVCVVDARVITLAEMRDEAMQRARELAKRGLTFEYVSDADVSSGAKPSKLSEADVRRSLGDASGALPFAKRQSEVLPAAERTCSQNGQGLTAKYTEIDAPLNWIFYSTGSVVFVMSNSRSLYRSLDDGATWTRVNDLLPLLNPMASDMVAWVIPTVNADKFYVGSYDNVHLWTTTDGGRTFKAHVNGAQGIFWINVHPTLENVAGAIGLTTECVKCDKSTAGPHFTVYLSKNFGDNWNVIQEYVSASDLTWSRSSASATKDDAMIVLALTESYGSHRDCSSHSDSQCFVLRVALSFALAEPVKSYEILFSGATQLVELKWSGSIPAYASDTDPYSIFVLREVGQINQLYTSVDGGLNWRRGFFPQSAAVYDYGLIDADDGAFVLASMVNRTDKYAKLWVSDGDGRNHFVEVNDNIHAINYGSMQVYADVERAQGMPGVYVLNRLVDGEADCYETLVSRDFGNTWSRFPAPATKSWACEDPSACYTHLAGRTAGIGRFYTTPGALGLWFGNGVVGKCIKQVGGAITSEHKGTYYTNDAGATWHEVANKTYTYELANHGALLIVGDVEDAGKTVRYSTNFGDDWHECTYLAGSADAVRLNNIQTRVVTQ